MGRAQTERSVVLSEPRQLWDARIPEAGLDAVQISPFSGTWMSYLDPTRAKSELGFHHESLASYLDATVAGLLGIMTDERPAGYSRRNEEIRLAEQCRGQPMFLAHARRSAGRLLRPR